MAQELNYLIFDTTAGWIGVFGSTTGLQSITLPQSSPQEARRQLGDNPKQATRNLPSFENLVTSLRLYFDGHRITFPDKLDLSQATPFQRAVWAVTRLIPYGETRSYTWVAEQIGKPRAVRAVGQALGRNPLPIIIPCHRVVAGDGKLGGFSGGLEMKRYLLSLEGSAREKP